VFENRVLRRIFGPTRDEVTEGWIKLHNDKLRNFYSSPNKITMMKSRRMRWAAYIVRMGIRGMPIGYLWEIQMGKDLQEDIDVSGKKY
jgi:hypothetical protein